MPRCGQRPPPSRWSSSATCAHAVVVSILTPAETLIAARRLAGARPHLAAVAGLVHHEDLWQLCRAELTGVDVRTGGWDIRGRWFGVVVGATPRLGELRRGQTIPWRVIASLIAAERSSALTLHTYQGSEPAKRGSLHDGRGCGSPQPGVDVPRAADERVSSNPAAEDFSALCGSRTEGSQRSRLDD